MKKSDILERLAQAGITIPEGTTKVPDLIALAELHGVSLEEAEPPEETPEAEPAAETPTAPRLISPAAACRMLRVERPD